MKESFQNACNIFLRALEFDPSNFAILFNLGNTYLALDEFENAIKYFEDAVKVDPENTEWHNYIGNVYLERRGTNGEINNEYLARAKEHFDASLKLDSNNVESHIKMANYYKVAGETDLALNELKIVLEINPENEEAKKLEEEINEGDADD